MLRLADKNAFPNIQEITIAGHSSGAQFVNRNAAGGTAQDDARSDLSWKYVVANPSTHMYMSDKRVVNGTMDRFEILDSRGCRSYNDYKHVLDDLRR